VMYSVSNNAISHCLDAVGLATGRVSGLQNLLPQQLLKFVFGDQANPEYL